MRHAATILAMLVSFAACFAGCAPSATQQQGNTLHNDTTGTKMKISIGTAVFTATLYDNAAATAFKGMLPLTISMKELNGNEKFHYFSATLPTNASAGGDIQVGDLMLYGNNCLVLFYEGFHTSYSYTKLGRIDNTSGLVDALGAGSVEVKFELE
ncbi:MAG: hypothetical protein EAZ89_20775 [Bacteroidetes bacterium]|nr:MAG: hypothetical protein EAZ89_20775 [Bacteroidota bacterium]